MTALPKVQLRTKSQARRPVLLSNWRYLRYEEALRIAQMDHVDAPQFQQALQEVQTVWRFPWPDEDFDAAGFNIEGIAARQLDRSLSVKLPTSLVGSFKKIEHELINTKFSAAHRQGHKILHTQCPASSTWHNNQHAFHFVIELCGQRCSGLEKSSAFRCGYCNTKFALQPHEIALIAKQISTSSVQGWIADWFRLVAGRMMPA